MSFLRVLFLLAFFFFKGFTCFVSSCSGHPQSILRSKRWNREHRDEFSFNDRGNEVRWHLKALSPKNGWRQRDGAATLRFYNNHQKVTFVQLVKGGSQVTECSQRSKPSKQTIAAITGLNIVLAAVLYFNLFASSLSKVNKGPAEISFFVTALVCTLLTSTANWGVFELLWEKNQAEKTKEMAEFSRFQLQYLSVHLISAFTDFMQGAYLYKIYEMSGYTMQETAFLYLFGFLSSLVFGFSAGRAVDARGRRAGALAHLALNAAQCLLLVWGARAPRRWGWPALVLGRALSGVATSLLMTSYECWMVAEHNRRGFAPELLSNTFTRYTFGMGAMAVLSGFVAGGLVKGGFGVDSPFSFCAGVSLANLALAAATWPENRGTDTLPVGNASAAAALHKSAPPRQRIAKPAAAAAALLGGPTAAPRRRGSAGGGSRAPLWAALRSPRVLLVGFVQAVFEAALMAFIFLWTPVLDAATKAAPLNHGFVFSTFMVAVMAGSSAFQLLLAAAGDGGGGGGAEEMVLLGALVLAGGALGAAAAPASPGPARLLATFVVFEAAVGAYYPALAALRAAAVPERVRATVMNAFRVALNALVVLLLAGPLAAPWPLARQRRAVFGAGAGSLLLGAVALLLFPGTLRPRPRRPIPLPLGRGGRAPAGD